MLSPTNAPVFRYSLSTGGGLLPTRRLAYEPTGWDAVGVSVHRDPQTHGLRATYAANLGFVKDGKAYLARAYQAAGVEADVQCLIEQLEPNAFTWLPYYAGRVNLAGAEFSDVAVKADLEEAGWLQKFYNRASVQVDLFSGLSVGGSTGPAPTPQAVILHSRALLQRYAARQVASSSDLSPGLVYGGDADLSHEQLLYFGFDTTDLNELNYGAAAGGFVTGSADEAVPILRMPGDGELSLEMLLRYHVHCERQTGFFYRRFKRLDVKYQLRIAGSVNETIDLLPAEEHEVDSFYDATVTLPPLTRTWQLLKDDAVYLYAVYFVHKLDGTDYDQFQATLTADVLAGSYLRLRTTTTTPATPTAGLLLYEAFERLVQALSDEVDVFRSDFFGRQDRGYAQDGPGAHTLLTSGFLVRGFPTLTDPAPAAGATDFRKGFTTSWDELAPSAQACWALGYGPVWEDGQLRLRVEPLAYWYGELAALDLTGAGVLTDAVKVVESRLYQTVETGYERWQAEAAGGLDEFNATRQYTTPLTVVSATYAAKSKVSASGMLLETTRRQRFDATATTDTSQDAVNFFVCLLPTPVGVYVTERNQRALLLTGVLDPASVYNLPLSPARLARRHAPAYGAGLRRAAPAGGLLRFAAGEGNLAVTSQLVGELAAIVENGDVALSDLPAALWEPEEISLRGVPFTRDQVRRLLAAPQGRVRYLSASAGGAERQGWVLDFTHQAAAATADFTLLPCAE